MLLSLQDITLWLYPVLSKLEDVNVTMLFFIAANYWVFRKFIELYCNLDKTEELFKDAP